MKRWQDKFLHVHVPSAVVKKEKLSSFLITQQFLSICLYLSSLLLPQVLLDDFSNCRGYKFLHDYLLYLERKANDETREVLRNVVLLIQSLVMAGFLSLEPTITDGGPFQDPDFQIPTPLDPSMRLAIFNIICPLILCSLINELELSGF